MKTLRYTNNNQGNIDEFDSANFVVPDNLISRQRLQGEFLQTVAKLTKKELQLKWQTKELDSAREELDSLRDGQFVSQLQNRISNLQRENKDTERNLKTERIERTSTLKEIDETIMYLMSDLARLKQEQSLML